MKNVNFKQQEQRGFILVTSLVLLAILTLLGIAAAYKTVIETKVSGMAVSMDRASAAAETGLTQAYWYWVKDTTQGITEAQTLTSYIAGTGGSAIAPYEGSFAPASIDDAAAMPTDANIQSATNQFFVFDITATNVTKVANNTWGTGSNQQVAVWVTSFNNETPPAFPYQTAVDLTTGATCASGCRMVTYALGRFGQARQLMRESQSVINSALTGVSAMTNAPAGQDFATICNDPGLASNVDIYANATAWPAGTAGNNSTVIEVTQAPYVLGSIPSGTAIASNTGLGSGGKGFRSGTSSQTGATFKKVPYLLYAGHGTTTGFKVDWASMTQDTTGADLPANKLPQKLVNAPLLGSTDQINYFSDPSQQLFSMDTYRWAAEQFTCQNPSLPDGESGNGIYCSKAEALRLALVNMGIPAYAPVTGRLNIAQIEYNIANGIPMFGIVRLMFPAAIDVNKNPASSTCNGVTTVNHVIEGKNGGFAGNGDKNSRWGDSFDKLMACDSGQDCNYTGSIPDPAGGQYAFTRAEGAITDTDGDLGTNARLIVYGTLLIDYFADYNIENDPGATAADAFNTVFDRASGERLLSPLESPDVYLAIEHNIMINPVMPRFAGDPLPFPTAAPQNNANNVNAPSPSRLGYPAPAVAGAATNVLTSADRVNMVDVNNAVDAMQGNAVNLASPYDGYFPWSEGLVPSAGVGNVGTMRLQSRATVTDNPSNESLVMMAVGVGGAGGVGAGTGGSEQTSLPASAGNLLALNKPTRAGQTAGTEADILHYYYKLMKETLDHSKANDWPVAAWPGNNLAGDFYIGAEDSPNNIGDKIHLMFPTGYMHGWKVALSALDMTADEWNHVLTGGGPAATKKGIADTQGLYDQLFNNCSQFGVANGGGCPMGLPFNFGVDKGALNKATVQGFQNDEGKYFNVTQDAATGYGVLDSAWQDIPATMYSGGLLDMHAHSNMNGIIYTPGPLEWEPGNSGYDTGVHMSYVNGSIITGFGAFTKNATADDRYVLVYDQQAVDNINVNQSTIVLRRYDYQALN